jgi:NADH-quinone oxidoreductase subunit E
MGNDLHETLLALDAVPEGGVVAPPPPAGAPAPELTLPSFGRALWQYRGQRSALIPLLQAAQETYGYVPEQAIHAIAGATGIPAAEVFGVVTFYAQFRLQPQGKYVLRLCTGTACHVNGAKALEETIEDELGIKRGETDHDRLFTMDPVACLGCCSLAPVIMINDDTHGKLDTRSLRKLLRRLRREARG